MVEAQHAAGIPGHDDKPHGTRLQRAPLVEAGHEHHPTSAEPAGAGLDHTHLRRPVTERRIASRTNRLFHILRGRAGQEMNKHAPGISFCPCPPEP